MSSAHSLSFVGLICPTDSCLPCPYGNAEPYWEARQTLSKLLKRHTDRIGQALKEQIYFYEGFEADYKVIAHAARVLDDQWALLCSRMNNAAHIFVMPDQLAMIFQWSFTGPSFVSLAQDGKLTEASMPPYTAMRSSSMLFETAAIKFLRVSLALQSSVRHLTRFEVHDALHISAIAVEIARLVARNLLPQHKKLADRSPGTYETPLPVSGEMWNRWFGALLLSQAKYCLSMRTEQIVGMVAAFDSAYLLELAVTDAPPLLIGGDHAARIRSATRKSQTLANIGTRLGFYALKQEAPQSLEIAASLLYWYGDRSDSVQNCNRSRFNNQYTTMTGKTPLLLFNHKTPVEMIRVDMLATDSSWRNKVLTIPNIPLIDDGEVIRNDKT